MVRKKHGTSTVRVLKDRTSKILVLVKEDLGTSASCLNMRERSTHVRTRVTDVQAATLIRTRTLMAASLVL